MIVKTLSMRESEHGSEYTHTIGTEQTTYYFPVQQNHILITNLGNASIVITMNGVSQTVSAGNSWTYVVEFVSFSIASQSGQQKFSVKTFVNKQSSTTASIDDLLEPFVIAHRGGSNTYPENTMVAFRNTVANGLTVIEMDVHTLSDGTLAVMHDSTVDRTTSSTGNVADFDAYSWSKLVVDASIWIPGAQNTTAPLFDDLLREFGSKVVYMPESKDSKSAEKIAQTLVKHGLQKNAIIQSFDSADLAKAVPYGIPTLLLGDAVNPTTAKASGFTYIGHSTSASDPYIQSILAAGLKPMVYTVNRRSDWDIWKQKGCVGCFSDDPLWVSGGLTPRKKDPFVNKSYYHGTLPLGSFSRGTFADTNKWGWAVTTEGSYVLQGWGSPIENAASTYSIQFNMTVETTNADTSRWGSCAFGSPTDFFQDTASTRSNAYHVLFRQSGIMVLFKVVNGVSTQLGIVTLAALVAAGTITIKIDVTPTTITVTRTDVAAPNFITVTDTSFRGGYFYFNNASLGVTFSNVNITP